MRTLRNQLVKPRAIVGVITVSKQDHAVGAVAVFIVDMPVARYLLERHQQVIALRRARRHDRAEHAEEERVDHRVVGRRIAEQQQRQRAGPAAAQVRCRAIDGVMQLPRDRFDACACHCADGRAAPQCTRYRRLRNPRQLCDIERGRLALCHVTGLPPHSMPSGAARPGRHPIPRAPSTVSRVRRCVLSAAVPLWPG